VFIVSFLRSITFERFLDAVNINGIE
jgi:hypothetical protein